MADFHAIVREGAPVTGVLEMIVSDTTDDVKSEIMKRMLVLLNRPTTFNGVSVEAKFEFVQTCTFVTRTLVFSDMAKAQIVRHAVNQVAQEFKDVYIDHLFMKPLAWG